MIILQTMKHNPEKCPLGTPKNLDIMIKWLENLENFAAKYCIKVIGVWTDRTAHTTYAVFDTPNMEAFTKFEVDPQNIPVVTLNYIEKKFVTQTKDTLAFFKEYKSTM